MREIKFRVWDKKKKLMHPPFDVYNVELNMWKTHREDGILMQWTGLVDKQGKEIYEGDIYRYWYLPDYDDNVVQWESGSFFLEDEHLIDVKWEEYEYIGNIYENPDILKNTNNNKKTTQLKTDSFKN